MQSLETCKLPVNILEHMFLHLLVLLYIIFTFHIFCLVLSIESWSMFDGLPPIFLESLIEEKRYHKVYYPSHETATTAIGETG